MTKTTAQALAREWLAAHPHDDIHGETFKAWAQARDLTSEAARQVRVAIVRARVFGAEAAGPERAA